MRQFWPKLPRHHFWQKRSLISKFDVLTNVLDLSETRHLLEKKLVIEVRHTAVYATKRTICCHKGRIGVPELHRISLFLRCRCLQIVRQLILVLHIKVVPRRRLYSEGSF